ncbi:unnamed protein product [Urochloa decumbens]|uniref:WRKY domain-containing protein n=1 Tax=Urochloa decumbens TaxID=240449 RepID=A0ABC8XE60_9POAL
MCDFFWLSPADQGDLSDVVRAAASLQHQPPPPPHHCPLPPATTPAPTVFCSNGSLRSHRLPEEEEDLLVHGNGRMVFPPQQPEAEGLLIPQLISSSSFVERDEDDAANAAPVVLDELGIDMPAMAPYQPHAASSIKRRKSQTKKVVCIPAPVAPPPGSGGRPSTSGEVVPSDLWAWRKYGQKPIKGSPYPRGYYRCSSSKGCSARKQVERSRTDPSMLVITYTSDHNHPWPTQRNALAGCIRPPPTAASASANKTHHRHHRHSVSSNDADNAATPAGSITASNRHQQRLLKEEVLDLDMVDNLEPAQDAAAAADHDLLGGMIADMDGALGVLCASGFHSKRAQQQQHATADPDYHLERLPGEEDKQHQLLDRDPFSFNFLDWVGASFGVGGEAAAAAAANKGGYSYT